MRLPRRACRELKPCTAEHWGERPTLERGRPGHTVRLHQIMARAAASPQARTPVLTRRARAAGPVPPCALLFWLDFGVATLDFVAPCRFAAPDGARALLSLDLVRKTRVGVARGEAARRRGVDAEA